MRWGHLTGGIVFAAALALLGFSPVFAQESPSPSPETSAEATPTPAPGDSVDEAATALQKNQEELAAKREEIADLTRQIEKLRSQHTSTVNEANIISNQIARLARELETARLELRQTELAVRSVRRKQVETAATVESLQQTIEERRAMLRQLVRLLYEREQTPLIRVLFDGGRLSDLVLERQRTQELEEKSTQLVLELRQREAELVAERARLIEQEQELAELQELQAAQQADLAVRRQEQEVFLKAKKEEQVKYEKKIADAEQARKEIEQDIFTLQGAGVKISLTEAKDIARFASKLTGVRAALLLGVLKVETNLGKNLGGGKFPGDMHPGSRDAFLRITKKLGLDPYNTPISARPKSYQGWGGAMGPGQFMPATWEPMEPRLAALLKKPLPNPYDLTDAFVATAMFLADRGATDRAKEYEAVNRYLAGPNWQRFTWYGDRVLAVAKEYEKEGL